MEKLVSDITPILEKKPDYDKDVDEYQLIFNEYEKLLQLYDIKGTKNDKSITSDVLSFFNYAPKKDENVKIVNSKGETVRFKNIAEKNEFLTYKTIIQLKETLFNLVVLFTHLLQIQCLREYNLHIAERNIIVMDKTILTNQILYYFMIKYHLQHLQETNINEEQNEIPYSVFWEISNLDTLEKINEKLLLATQTNEIQDSKIKNNGLHLKQFFSNCELFSRYLTPVISKKGFQIYLTQLLNGFQLSQYISDNNLLAFSLFNKEINVEAANFDIENTVKLNSAFFKEYPLLEQGWIVYNSKNLLDSIASALNGQLDYLNADSVNYYTEPNENNNGLNRFTVKTLLELIKDNGYDVEHKNIQLSNNATIISVETKNIIKILESVLGITFICFYINKDNQVEILCSENYNEINDVLYLFIDKNKDDEIVKLVRNTNDIDTDGYYIYSFSSIPNQIKELYKSLCIVDKEIVDANSKIKYLGEFGKDSTELFGLDSYNLSDLNQEELLDWFRKLDNEIDITLTQYENIFTRYDMIISTQGEYEKKHLEIKNLEPDVIYLISKFQEIVSLYNKYESAMYDGDNEDGGDIIEAKKIKIQDFNEKIKRLDQIKSGIHTSEYYDIDKLESILEYFINLYNIVTPETNCEKISSQANGYKQLLENIGIYNENFHTGSQFKPVLDTVKINNLTKLITKVLQKENITNKPDFTEGIVIQGTSDITDSIVNDFFKKIEPFIQILDIMTTDCQDPSSRQNKTFQDFLDELVQTNIESENVKGTNRVYDKDADDESSYYTGKYGDIFSESSSKKAAVKSPGKSVIEKLFPSDVTSPSLGSESGDSSVPISRTSSLSSDSGSENGDSSVPASRRSSFLSELTDEEHKGGEKKLRTQYEDLQSPFLNQMPYSQTYPYGSMPYSQTYPMGQQPSQLYPAGQLINYTHNEQYNIAKEKKSKLSYYIEIELELYPGTEVNPVQRLAVKCQSQFERIREAWADIFGFQYRPALLKEAYAYQATPIQKKTDDNKETENDNKETKSGGYSKKTIKRQKNPKRNKSAKRGKK